MFTMIGQSNIFSCKISSICRNSGSRHSSVRYLCTSLVLEAFWRGKLYTCRYTADGSYCGGYYDSTSCYEDYGCYVPEPEPEPDPDIKCNLYALCYSGSGSSYKLYVNSNCTLKNTFATGCSKSDVNSSKFYAKTSNGGSCVMGATFVENGKKASNTLKIDGGVGYYKRTSSWSKMNTC